ncbi:hypothetical protein B4N89_27995 [Embleya scabrispora]|uniref:Uncharacterized protein n=1 Tax=Embleya scabrispora TaxID=159449 RepID=A0A1T3P5M5_9ACTN|nr:hypothetical protein B4N89_27995 [Embleya scabrispora]
MQGTRLDRWLTNPVPRRSGATAAKAAASTPRAACTNPATRTPTRRSLRAVPSSRCGQAPGARTAAAPAGCATAPSTRPTARPAAPGAPVGDAPGVWPAAAAAGSLDAWLIRREYWWVGRSTAGRSN